MGLADARALVFARAGGQARLPCTSGAISLSRHVTDGPDNANNRFAVASQINAHLSSDGPFWGRPETAQHRHLQPTKPKTTFPDRRHVETLVPSAQSVWKLYTTGSVGSQSLMGLPLIHRLSGRLNTAVWPFEPPTAQLVIAEIYASSDRGDDARRYRGS